MLKYNVKILMSKYDVKKMFKYLGKHKMLDGKKHKTDKNTSVDLKWTAKAVHNKGSYNLFNYSTSCMRLYILGKLNKLYRIKSLIRFYSNKFCGFYY